VLPYPSLIPVFVQVDAHSSRRGGMNPQYFSVLYRFPQEFWGMDQNLQEWTQNLVESGGICRNEPDSTGIQ